ncbi:hypothetical protein GYA49_06140 [Candidatus Beckwithbacteria bacterium]|nr:hypothetical protein [Candidatus Beckwithbacteria bacterium]
MKDVVTKNNTPNMAQTEDRRGNLLSLIKPVLVHDFKGKGPFIIPDTDIQVLEVIHNGSFGLKCRIIEPSGKERIVSAAFLMQFFK